MRWRPTKAIWAAVCLGMMSGVAWADDGAASPLTLQAALSAPLQQQYGVMGAEADLLGAKANQQEVQSWYDPTVSVEGRLRYIQPSNAAPDPNVKYDNALGISARQRLFDFGRQSLRDRSGEVGRHRCTVATLQCRAGTAPRDSESVLRCVAGRSDLHHAERKDGYRVCAFR